MDITNLTCASCGAPLPPPDDACQVTCPFCSTTVLLRRDPDDEPTPQPPSEDTPVSARDWKIALAFCAVAGFTGVHRFYTGHMVTGIAMFASSGGFGLWWIIDLILILTGQFKDSEGRYLRDPNPVVGHGCLWALLAFLFFFFIGSIAAMMLENEVGALVAVPLAFVLAAGAFVLGYRRKSR